MKSKWLHSVFVLGIVFTIIVVGSSSAFAQDLLEDDDYPKYDSHPYFQSVSDEAHYNRHYNTTESGSEVWGGEVVNDITIDARVRDVAFLDGDQQIRVAVNAYGRVEEKAIEVDYDGGTYWQNFGTRSLEIHGELGEDAPQDAKLGLNHEFNRRSNMTGDDNDIGGGEGDHDKWTDIAEIGMGAFANAVPVFGQCYTISAFMSEHYMEGGSWEIFNPSGHGPGGDAGQAFEVRPDYWPGFGNEHEVDGRNFFYSASTQFTVTVPGEIPDEMHISFSANNQIGYWEGNYNYPGTEDGAEASVEIPIRNAEIEEVESDNKDSYGDSVSVTNRDGSLYWDDEIAVSLNRPDRVWTLFDSPPSREIPRVDLSVNWGDGTEEAVKENWEPYRWEFDEEGTIGYYWESVNKETSISHVYDLEGDLGMVYGDDMTVTIEITAEVLDQYGGWEETVEFDLTIKYREPFSYPGPIPPGGSHPVGEDYPTAEDL